MANEVMVVLEMAKDEDLSEFTYYIPEVEGTDLIPGDGWYRQSTHYTDDSAACSRCIRNVTGHRTAVHPRDWP